MKVRGTLSKEELQTIIELVGRIQDIPTKVYSIDVNFTEFPVAARVKVGVKTVYLVKFKNNWEIVGIIQIET